MMTLTKTEILVLELFVSKPTDSFTIREVSRLIQKDLKIVHTFIKRLEKNNFFLKDRHGHLKLDYKSNISSLSYVESLRKEKRLQKYPALKIFLKDFLKKTKHHFFMLLLFGSYAEGKPRKDSDVDILAVLPQEDKDELLERELNSVASLSPLRFHINIITQESFMELIVKREELNVVNEMLDRHIILFGGEIYYKLLGERDAR